MRPNLRAKLLSLANEILEDPKILDAEDQRVGTIKVLVALLPASVAVIKSWIQSNNTLHAMEIQFTLFCYLDNTREFPEGRLLSLEIPKLLERYLMHARSATAHAAWMAGDLLGDHWLLRTAVPVLSKVLDQGHYLEGRMAALHGLEQALSRARKGSGLAKEIFNAIKNATLSDRSSSVRSNASHILRSKTG